MDLVIPFSGVGLYSGFVKPGQPNLKEKGLAVKYKVYLTKVGLDILCGNC